MSYANGIAVLSDALDMFGLGAVAADERMNPAGDLSFTERTRRLGGMSGS
jgi:hypothetical protein